MSRGVSARTKRGGFGRTWWGKAFIDAVEAMSEPGRLARGRGYARAGNVIDYRIDIGIVVAEVQGSQPRPFTAEFTVRRLREEEIELLVETIRAAPGTLADIASGVLPAALGPHLLPTTAADLDFSCTCPDPGWPCKHAAAVCYLLAERFDEAPREILTLRGLDLDALIARLERTPDPGEDDTADLTDPYGDRRELPMPPRIEFRSVIEDLDPMLLRKALRMVSEDETNATTALKELRTLYGALERS
ncbi:SWIM zinc finger family protein [Nocardia shimofusensis]|uniref:SWIM zinc finger family protein n=1 Tax=Nocardia shimofusensis TaxID=228596 RepID=UPI00082B28DD|nr:SWIM zinc finger family protein [Nocardia shimofusensis]